MKYQLSFIFQRLIFNLSIFFSAYLLFISTGCSKAKDDSTRSFNAGIYTACNSNTNFSTNDVEAVYDATVGESTFNGTEGLSELGVFIQGVPAPGTYINDGQATVYYDDGSGAQYGSYNPAANASGGTISVDLVTMDGNRIKNLRATLTNVQVSRVVSGVRESLCINGKFLIAQ